MKNYYLKYLISVIMFRHKTNFSKYKSRVKSDVTLPGLKSVVRAPRRLFAGYKIKNSALPKWIRPEVKKFDYSPNGATAGDSSSPLILPGAFSVPQGDDVASRQGNKIFCKSLMVRYYVQPDPAITFQTTMCAIVVDRQPAASSTASPPSWSQVFTDYSDRSKNMLTNQSVTGASRYKIVYRKLHPAHVWPYNAVTPANTIQPMYGKYKVRLNKLCNFGASNNIDTGARVYLYFWNDQASNPPTVVCTTRLYYTDA